MRIIHLLTRYTSFFPLLVAQEWLGKEESKPQTHPLLVNYTKEHQRMHDEISLFLSKIDHPKFLQAFSIRLEEEQSIVPLYSTIREIELLLSKEDASIEEATIILLRHNRQPEAKLLKEFGAELLNRLDDKNESIALF